MPSTTFMHHAPSPVPFLAGLSQERLARVAARLAFVEMKLSFIRAAAQVAGPAGTLLQKKVRMATEVTHLWRLREALFARLPAGDSRCDALRGELQYHLDSAYPPDVADATVFQA